MGFTFLTPIDALFALAAAIPLAALWLAQSRMDKVRRVFSLRIPRRRELNPFRSTRSSSGQRNCQTSG